MRLSAVLAVLMILLALGGAAGMVLLGRGDDASDDHDRKLEELGNTERLRAAYLSQAAAFRAFLVSGEESQLIGEEAARFDQARLTEELRAGELTADEIATLDRVAISAQRWQAEAVEPLIALRRTSDANAVSARFGDVESFALFGAIEDELDVLRSQLAVEAAESQAAAAGARRDVGRLAVGLLLLAVAVVATAAIAGRRWVTGPLLALERAVRGVQAGDLTTVITSSGPAEIAALGTEVESMRKRIGVELEATLRSQEGLAQNATVLMSVRSRLESAPELMPSGWSVSANLTPASGVVAGDCYDVSMVQQSRLAVVVVDVAGHGAESAVIALRTKELLRAAVRTYVELGEGVRWVNRQLDGLAPGMFVSAFVAVLDTVTGSLDYVSAGHPPALLCGTDGVTDLPATGPIIGPFEAVWGSGHTTIEAGQTFVVYTDGLIEVRDDARVEFGLDRLRKVVRAEFDDAEAAVKRCLDETSEFSTTRGQDDVTIVAVCHTRV